MQFCRKKGQRERRKVVQKEGRKGGKGERARTKVKSLVCDVILSIL